MLSEPCESEHVGKTKIPRRTSQGCEQPPPPSYFLQHWLTSLVELGKIRLKST